MSKELISDEELFRAIVKVSDVEQSKIDWVVDGWIPRGRITFVVCSSQFVVRSS